MNEIVHGAAVLLLRADDSILCQHRDNRPDVTHADHWAYPAGRVEPEDKGDWEAAARRELHEETGYIAGEVELLLEEDYTRFDGSAARRHIYWTMYDEKQPIECLEGQEIRFMSIDDLADKQIVPGQYEVMKKAVAAKHQKYPKN